jgi:[glutamine synthetase] adenylyltransferase / [glutamine synthetase]-adenylyl-L-tyrosine phosphorylase
MLAELVKTAPVLPARRQAATLCREELLSRIEPDPVRNEMAALLEAHPLLAELVAGILAHSPFLAQAMRLAPEALLETLSANPGQRLDAIFETARQALSGLCDLAEAMAPLRCMRRDVAVLVALADIGGVWPLMEVTAALTSAADLAVSLTIDIALRQAAESGRIKLLDAANPGPGSGLVVLALGKHGAGELNYSSDIDLVLFFDAEVAEAAGVSDPTAFFARISRELTKTLQERTGDGYVHRVDLRLRPDPGSTPPAVSLTSAYAYYESVGQNWERAAYIKARSIAGDIGLGERFLKDLTPFIWRKYFDFAAIADIHAMKRQIQAVKGHETIAVAGHDVKLGRGGIREVEFFVQTQQLVFGGRNPVLRGRRTLDMLAALARGERISVAARDGMSDAYRELRRIEHRLQMRHDEQTQRLPDDPADLEAFARFAGFRGLAAFDKSLRRTAQTVERHYAQLFEAGPSLASDAGTLSFTGADLDPQTLATLRQLGFRNAEAAAETVRGWHFGRRPAVSSARAREALTELTPSLLVAIGRTAGPDSGLAALDRAFERMPAANELMTLLRSNAMFFALFAELLGGAPRLAGVLSTHPHVLDGVIDPGFVNHALSTSDIMERIRADVGVPVDREDFLDRLRDAVRPEAFLIGARLLSGILAPERAGMAYTSLAEAAIAVAFSETRRFFEQEHGCILGAEIAVIAMGRLGSRNLTAGSDLDLVIVYDRPEDAGASNGPKPLDPVSYHIRLVQRLMAALSAPTRRGTLYEIDLRLRPEGNKSPPATQWSSFLAYHDKGAETWELMALAKARVIAGDQALGAVAAARIAEVLSRPRDAAKVAAHARAMRALLASEKGNDIPWDLKRAAGGLTDLDFLAEYLVLTAAHAAPALLCQRADDVFKAATGAGLLTAQQGVELVSAFRLFDDVTQWQRFAWPDQAQGDDICPSMLARVAAGAGVPDGPHLKAHLDATRASVLAIIASVMPGGWT